jgi:hypothetical protein
MSEGVATADLILAQATRGESAAQGSVAASAPAPRAGSPGVLVGLGMALALVGWSDLLLNLYPLRIGNPDWEVGTTSVIFDSLPLATIGLGVALHGALAGRRVWGGRILGAAALLVFAGMVTLLGLYLLALPVVWRALSPAVQQPFLLSSMRTLFVASVYLVLYGWLGVAGIRRSRAVPRDGR